MIVTRIDLLENYEDVLAGSKKAYSIFTDLQKKGFPPVGKYTTDDENIFYIISEYETAAENSKQFEAHAKYADIQIVLEGKETSAYSSEKCTAPVNEENDCALCDAVATEHVTLAPGIAAIYLPGELHKPSCNVDEKCEKIKKILFKIKY